MHEIREYTRDVDAFVLRRSYEYTYDTLGRLVNFVERDGTGTIVQHGNHSFDDAGRMTDFRYTIPGIMPAAGVSERNTDFTFDENTGNLTRMGLASGDSWGLDYTYDNLQRLHSRTLVDESRQHGLHWRTLYDYRNRNSTDTTLQVRFLTHEIGQEALRFEYGYDSIGQITWWRDPVHHVIHSYDYDGQNQLTGERIIGGARHHEFAYTYDTFGNIRERRHWRGPSQILAPETTTTFYYENATWPDLLTAVQFDDEPERRYITYDYSGNPTRWHDERVFVWERGRQLTHVHRPDRGYAAFHYDVNGIRTQALNVQPDGSFVRSTFYTQGGRIVAERREFEDGRVHTLEFFYDEAGRPMQVFFCNGAELQRLYNYVLNLQGDVIEIRNSENGMMVAQYLYNAWGELLEYDGWFAVHNPLRYRGYFWCSAIGMYYLQTRYYDPAIGRFINADSYISTGLGLLGFNMFSYTDNNPANRIDVDGRRWTHFQGVNTEAALRNQRQNQAATGAARGATAGAVGAARVASTGNRTKGPAHQGQRRGNTCPQAAIDALEAFGSAWYRGAPVRHPPSVFGPMAIFGTIWLPKGWRNPDTVTHEWGHLVDERYRGPLLYFVTVGVPSVISVSMDPDNHSTRWFEQRADNFAAQYSTLPGWRSWKLGIVPRNNDFIEFFKSGKMSK